MSGLIKNKIEAVIFDFDNTLTNTSKSITRARKEVFVYIKKRHDITEKTYLEALQNASTEFRAKNFSDNIDLYRILSKYAELSLSEKETIECKRIFIDSMLSHMEFSKGIRPLFKWIKSQGLKIGILTDNSMFPDSDYKKKRLGNLPVINMVDLSVIATQTIPESKETPASFIKTAEMLGINPKKIIYVGDKPDNDIDNAKRANMIAVLFLGFSHPQHNVKDFRPDYIIDDLNDLVDIIKKYI